ncbi:MAG: YidB family protein [Actinomycetota bacterium]
MGVTSGRLVAQLLGRVTDEQRAELLEAATEVVSGQGSGLSDLLGRLSSGGLGAQVQSWIDNDPNVRVSGRDIRRAAGDVAVERIAARAGVSRRQAAGGLATLLPTLVDQLSPNGELLSGDGLQSALASALGELRT